MSLVVNSIFLFNRVNNSRGSDNQAGLDESAVADRLVFLKLTIGYLIGAYY